MGTTGAMGMSDAVNHHMVNLDAALHWHLQHNHYPPIPVGMIPVAKAAIEALNEDDCERDIELPEGVMFRDGSTSVPAWQIAESMHLYPFVDNDDDDDEDYDD